MAGSHVYVLSDDSGSEDDATAAAAVPVVLTAKANGEGEGNGRQPRAKRPRPSDATLAGEDSGMFTVNEEEDDEDEEEEDEEEEDDGEVQPRWVRHGSGTAQHTATVVTGTRPTHTAQPTLQCRAEQAQQQGGQSGTLVGQDHPRHVLSDPLPALEPSRLQPMAEALSDVPAREDAILPLGNETEEESLCPICLEPWTSSGPHR